MINLFGELHPSYLSYFRSTSENISFLISLLVKVSKRLSFSDFDFIRGLIAKITDNHYDNELLLFDKSLKSFYSFLTKCDCLLIESFFDDDDLSEKLSSRFIDSACFSKALSLDEAGYQFKSNESREAKWLEKIKALSSYDLTVIVGASHLRSESVVSESKLRCLIPGVVINQYLMNYNLTPKLASDCERLNKIVSRFYNLYE